MAAHPNHNNNNRKKTFEFHHVTKQANRYVNGFDEAEKVLFNALKQKIFKTQNGKIKQLKQGSLQSKYGKNSYYHDHFGIVIK